MEWNGMGSKGADANEWDGVDGSSSEADLLQLMQLLADVLD